MAVSAGPREPAPLAPVHCIPNAISTAGSPDRSSLHQRERGSPMKNRKREICTSGSVRDEDGQPPHLLGHVTGEHACVDVVAAAGAVADDQVHPLAAVEIGDALRSDL